MALIRRLLADYGLRCPKFVIRHICWVRRAPPAMGLLQKLRVESGELKMKWPPAREGGRLLR
jgi:hypothetical protein